MEIVFVPAIILWASVVAGVVAARFFHGTWTKFVIFVVGFVAVAVLGAYVAGPLLRWLLSG